MFVTVVMKLKQFPGLTNRMCLCKIYLALMICPGIVYICANVPVVQWIELLIPVQLMGVRIPSGTLLKFNFKALLISASKGL